MESIKNDSRINDNGTKSNKFINHRLNELNHSILFPSNLRDKKQAIRYQSAIKQSYQAIKKQYGTVLRQHQKHIESALKTLKSSNCMNRQETLSKSQSTSNSFSRDSAYITPYSSYYKDAMTRIPTKDYHNVSNSIESLPKIEKINLDNISSSYTVCNMDNDKNNIEQCIHCIKYEIFEFISKLLIIAILIILDNMI